MVEDTSCVCVDAPVIPPIRELLRLNHREEAIVDLEASLRSNIDGNHEILNGPIEE